MRKLLSASEVELSVIVLKGTRFLKSSFGASIILKCLGGRLVGCGVSTEKDFLYKHIHIYAKFINVF
jgi:hypothetical protein